MVQVALMRDLATRAIAVVCPAFSGAADCAGPDGFRVRWPKRHRGLCWPCDPAGYAGRRINRFAVVVETSASDAQTAYLACSGCEKTLVKSKFLPGAGEVITNFGAHEFSATSATDKRA